MKVHRKCEDRRDHEHLGEIRKKCKLGGDLGHRERPHESDHFAALTVYTANTSIERICGARVGRARTKAETLQMNVSDSQNNERAHRTRNACAIPPTHSAARS